MRGEHSLHVERCALTLRVHYSVEYSRSQPTSGHNSWNFSRKSTGNGTKALQQVHLHCSGGRGRMETVWRGHNWGALLGATLICSALYYFTFVIHYNNRLVLNTMVVVLCGLSTWLSEVITGSLFLLDGKDKATVDSDSSIHTDDKRECKVCTCHMHYVILSAGMRYCVCNTCVCNEACPWSTHKVSRQR